jgi:hypothetical protein
MIRTPVESSSIKSVGYEADTETLEICFASDAVYNFAGVPEATYHMLMASESKGHYFAVGIRGTYESTRLHDKGCRMSDTCWCKRERRKEESNAKPEEGIESKSVTRRKAIQKRGRPAVI